MLGRFDKSHSGLVDENGNLGFLKKKSVVARTCAAV